MVPRCTFHLIPSVNLEPAVCLWLHSKRLREVAVVGLLGQLQGQGLRGSLEKGAEVQSAVGSLGSSSALLPRCIISSGGSSIASLGKPFSPRLAA